MRSMLIRVRSQEKCDDTSALTSNLLVSSCGFVVWHRTHFYFFPNLVSASPGVSLKSYRFLPLWPLCVLPPASASLSAASLARFRFSKSARSPSLVRSIARECFQS